MNAVDSVKAAINVVPFVGHNTLRMLAGIAYDSLPNEGRLLAMEALLRDAMEAGCFGLTTGLEYTPGYYAGSAELIRLAKVVGKENGMIMSHLRNEDDAYIKLSIKELLMQGNYCPVHISHLKIVYGKGKKRALEILDLLDSAGAVGITVTADVYPYTASYTGIDILFPDWARKPNDFKKVLTTRRAELALYLRKKIAHRNGPEATLIGSGAFKGQTLAAISESLDKSVEEVLMDDIGPYGASGAYFVMDEAIQEVFITAPHVNICTDGSPAMRHPRGYGTFARIIESYVIKKRLFPLEAAVYKMSGLPAQTIGLKNRGMIKQGYKADLLLFDPSSVRENATYQNPHALASGFRYVIVNGKVVKEADKFAEVRNGKVLRKMRKS